MIQLGRRLTTPWHTQKNLKPMNKRMALLNGAETMDFHTSPIIGVLKSSRQKEKIRQQARLNSEDVAQNRGGSCPFTERQQFMGAKFGPEKATTLNTFSAMKTGFKNVDSNGNIGPIPSQKAQRLVRLFNRS